MTKQNVSADQRLREHVTVCIVEDCAGLVHARGWCDMHYQRWLNGPRRPRSAPSAEAFAASIRARTARAQEKAAVLAEEIEWFLAAGESPQMIMSVVGYTKPSSLARQLHRHGHHELARKFEVTYDPEYSARYRSQNGEKVREWNRKAVRKYRYGDEAVA